MQSIIATIRLGQAGREVANLQDALFALLERPKHQIIWPIDEQDGPTPEEREKLTQGLKQERMQSPQAVFGEVTARLVRDFQNQQRLSDKLGDKLRGVVEDLTAAKLNQWLEKLRLLDIPEPEPSGFVVRGTVTAADGQPLPGAVVDAFDRDLRKQQRLGERAKTDGRGQYIIRYGAGHFAVGDLPSATAPYLIVRAFAGDQQIGKDITRPKPERDEVIDFKVPAPVSSEWERLCAGVIPLLIGQGEKEQPLPPWEINDNDLNFIVEETGLEKEQIRLWALAFAVGREAAAVMHPTIVIGGPGAPTRALPDPVSIDGLSTFATFYGWFHQGMPTDWETLRTRPISTLRKALLDAIDQNVVPEKLRENVENILARIPNPQIRELATALERARLSEEKMRAVLTQVDALAAVSDEVLTRLVEQKALDAQDAEAVGLSVSLHRLAGSVPSIVSTMLDSRFPSLKTGRLEHARDLALLEPQDWQTVLEQTNASAPDGVSRAELARSLAMEAVSAFPHAAFVQRATSIPTGIDDRVKQIQPLLEKNKDALTRDFEELDLAGVNDTDRDALQQAHTHLKRLANLHPGLGLHEVFSRQDSIATAVELVGERIGWLRTVFELNQDKNFLSLDYLPDSADLKEITFGSLPDEARGLVLQDLKAHQRIHTVANNAIPAREIMQAGFHSASAIALTRASDFAQQTGLPEAEARAYREGALALGNAAASRYFKLLEVARDKATVPIRAIPSPAEFFKPLKGFAELINDQPWCECEHCQSVLSPAAYFVDLMHYIEQNILISSFKGHEKHPLHLQIRRPDLWDLELTCKNTNEYVPYLDVVNEILERYLWETLPHPVGATLTKYLYEHLAEQDGSFQQPFTLPIERLEILLGHFGLSRYEVAKAMGADRTTQARARLKISQKEHDLITRERTTTDDLPFLKQVFKITKAIVNGVEIKDPKRLSSVDTLLDPLEMQTFLQATSLTHEIVEAVLKTDFVNTDGSTNAKISVVIGKRAADDVQNNSELVKQISLRRLDRIHRFVRLWRKLPWTIEELDYVLTTLTSPQTSSRIDAGTTETAGTLEQVLDLLDLNAKWALPIDELLALGGVFPPKGLREPTSLFDRLFNQAPFLDRDGHWPPTAPIRFVHPAWRKKDNSQGVSDPNNNTLTRLLAGLQVADKELLKLIEGLALAIGYQPATTTADESILLSEKSIGILYRHARLIRLLKSTVTDFLKLIKLTPRISTRPLAEQYVRDLEDVTSVIEFASWQRASGFSLDEISYLTVDPKPEGSPEAVKVVTDIIASVKTEQSLEFADTVFTQVGLTDLQSRQIVVDNVSTTNAFELLPDGKGYRVKEGFDIDKTPLLIRPSLSSINREAVIELVRKNQGRSDPFTADVFTQVGLTDLQSRQVLFDNLSKTAAFEMLSDGLSYRLKPGFDPSETPLWIDPSTKPPVDTKLLINLLKNYYPLRVLDVALGNALKSSPEEMKELRELAYGLSALDAKEIAQAIERGADETKLRKLTDDLIAADLTAIGEAMQGLQDKTRLTELISDTMRYRALFKSEVFEVKSLRFVRSNRAVFFGAPSNPPNNDITRQVVRNVAAYVGFARSTNAGFIAASEPADIDALQIVVQAINTAGETDLARALRTDKTRIGALKPHLVNLPANPFDALTVVAQCLVFTEQLGVSGETLSLMINEGSTPQATFVRLSRAAEDVFGAFRARYPAENTFQEKMEPFEDKLRTRKRDGLVDFLVSEWPEPFANANKLYEYFLIDVLMEGCARTSPVVAAISSLQLYVHRVLMNLESSKDWMPNIAGGISAKSGVYAHFTDADKQAEWYWRENYRVWEANRKVFLYPENYIEPELRDDKTPLFKELEDTLLQQEISDSNVHDAYAKYLTGFDEVARLKIAGTYYDGDADVLHLFGVTQEAPPVYFYRTITKSKSQVPRISAWQKLSLQIPIRKVSPILFEERLYVFWLETTTRPHSIFDEGKSVFQGYRHNVRIKYSTLRTDGAWTAPQGLSFSNGVAIEESRIINDPLPTDAAKNEAALRTQIGDLKKRVIDLEGAEKTASGEVRDKHSVVVSRQGEMKAASLQDDDVQAVAEAALASSAAVSAAAFAAFAGPPAQAAAFALAWWEVLALWVQKPVSELVAAGVNMMDAPHMARRKHALWLAKVLEGIAANTLMTVSEALKKVRSDLARLEEALAKRNSSVRWDKSRRDHTEPLDNYKPEGWEWDRVYPDVYIPPSAPEAKSIRLMLVPRTEMPAVNDALLNLTADEVDLSSGVLRQLPRTDSYAGAEIVTRINNSHGDLQLRSVYNFTYGGPWFYLASFLLNYVPDTRETTVAVAPGNSDLQVVNGNLSSVIIESQGHAVWMRKIEASKYLGTRLGTTLTAALANQFGHRGASSLLEAGFQRTLTELPPKITPISDQSDLEMQNPFHPTNPFLTYFRETFFHIPFLVANHLNSQQKFAETQRWYHYIFNPTAADGLAWRYREFRDPSQTTQSLRAMLTDEDALAAYREDPFNPHAIARTRLSAYQKSIVMKYIDNLLDWGDSLFNQFTMESVNEATMLYVMAQDILGPRPAMLGSCGEGKGFSETNKKTYKTIRPKLMEISDFLIELEAPAPPFDHAHKIPLELAGEAQRRVVSARQSSQQASTMSSGPQPPSPPISIGPAAAGPFTTEPSVVGREIKQTSYWTNVGGTALKDLYESRSGVNTVGPTILDTDSGAPSIPGNKTGNIDFINPKSGFAGREIGVPGGGKITPFDRIPTPDVKYGRRDFLDIEHPLGAAVPDRKRPLPAPHQVEFVPPRDLVFCIPPNKDLLAYWGRVEDRLFKIRNCMDIDGVRRRLELFAPEIDPRFLVRMKAARLTLDDVLNSTSGNLPPYRFTYLIEKARQYAGTLQSFGSQLLSAIEKRDCEELAHLRAVHEQNLLKMRSRMTRLEIDAAEDTIEGLRRQKAAAEYRRDHFRSISDVGSIASERKQQQHQREASNLRTQASVAQFIAAILSIIPDMGAPTAMKFGGSQLGAAGRAAADGLNALASFNEMSASMAGMEASNQRRDQEWKHQIETAKLDIAQIEKQVTAAEIRRDIAVHSLEVHERAVDQAEEVFDFFRDKFSSFGRYTLLSTLLHGLYRQAFNAALSMARMAEQAYRAERTDDNGLLEGNYWDAGNAGLLAGERLLLDLQALERQYIEKNYRQLEIEQSFSLAQFAPDALETLRLTGECRFDIPEWFFDLTYPGQYRRRLKAARLTIPCVTGPYTNVGATLRLEHSTIRLTLPQPLTLQTSLPALTPVPLRHTVVIASSKAQSDAGVFDFSFRDERYMPFEGAGAISTWQLSLPKALRVFDYGTISDVIVHLSYTAEFNEDLKAVREDGTQGLIALLENQPMTRLFSLRKEFPDAFHRLMTSLPNTEIDFTIDARHFPLFLAGKDLRARYAKVRVISPLSSLAGQSGSAGKPSRTSLAIAQKGESPAFRDLPEPDAPETPIYEVHGGGMREFDLGDVLENLNPSPPAIGPLPGIAQTLNGEYLIKLTAAGALAPDPSGSGRAAIDPAKLHDIILEVSYSLAKEHKA